MADNDEISRPQATAKVVGLCDRQLRILENAGLFPRRFPLSPDGRAKGHLKSEVLEWIQERAASREGAAK